jgi:CheY-like chemotaxis protein
VGHQASRNVGPAAGAEPGRSGEEVRSDGEEVGVHADIVGRVPLRLRKITAFRGGCHGRAALDYLVDPDSTQPFVILLHITMPVMSGWELLAILKSYLRLASIPVVMISGNPLSLDLIKHGAISAFIRKPYDIDEVLAVVAKHRPSPT